MDILYEVGIFKERQEGCIVAIICVFNVNVEIASDDEWMWGDETGIQL